MGFWIYITIMELLIPAVMIVCAIWFMKKPPAKINYLTGYRSKRSMLNNDTWNFAHRYCGRVWLAIGLILVPADIIAMLFMLGKSTAEVGNFGTILLFAQIVALLATFFIVERKLKQTFDDYGRRRG